MFKANYHSHSTFCDGTSSMEQVCRAAFDRGFDYWGVSSHAPLDLKKHFGIKTEDVPLYLSTIQELKEKYQPMMKVFSAMEIDFVTDLMEQSDVVAKKYSLDYFIGSVHQVKEHNLSKETWFIDGHDSSVYDRGLEQLFDMDIKRAVRCYYQQQMRMVSKCKPDIIGHFTKVNMHNKGRYFSEQEPWYEDLVMSLIDCLIKNDTVVEINTRGLYKGRHDDYYPSKRWIKVLIDKSVPLVISTDCHNATEVDAYYQEALDTLQALGCKQLWYFDGQWKSQFFD